MSASPNPSPGPSNPRGLSGRLRRAMTFLRKIDIEIEFRKDGRARTRIICITTPNQAPLEHPSLQSSAPSAQSAFVPKCNSANDIEEPGTRTVANYADDIYEPQAPIVRANALKFNTWDDADDADANSGPRSAPEEPAARPWRRRL